MSEQQTSETKGLPDVGAYIREQRRKAHLSLRNLADRAGVSNPYLSQKVREIPGVSKFVEQSKKFGEKSVLDHARELEPKLREFGTELQTRGEKAVARLREQSDEVRKQIQNFPTDARKQLKEFPDTARK